MHKSVYIYASPLGTDELAGKLTRAAQLLSPKPEEPVMKNNREAPMQVLPWSLNRDGEVQPSLESKRADQQDQTSRIPPLS